MPLWSLLQQGSQLTVCERVTNSQEGAYSSKCSPRTEADAGLRSPCDGAKNAPGQCHALCDTVSLAMRKKKDSVASQKD